MEERKGSLWHTIGLIFALALTVSGVTAVLVLGPEQLGEIGRSIGSGLAFLFYAAGGLLLLLGLAKVVHNWRIPERPAPVVEHHYHHDGTTREVRILDGRAPAQTDVRLLQLPNSGMGGMPNIWPALMAGAAQWGAQNAGSAELPRPADGSAGPVDDASFDEDEWNGVIR